MPDVPIMVFRVSDVDAARDFFTRAAGFTADPDAGAQEPGVAAMVTHGGSFALLIGDGVADPAPYLARALVVHKPGDTLSALSLPRSDLDVEATRLASQGYTDVMRSRTTWGDEVLSVRGPDGYTLAFTQRLERTPAEWVDLYARGPQALDDALAGLSQSDLDLAPVPSQWSIRQIVHHIAEGDDLWALPLKVALAKPGAPYRQDWYTPDNAWADLLDYARRPAESALALFHATRAHMADLLRHLGPDVVWSRSVMYTWPGQQQAHPITVGEMVESQAIHPLAHADEIRAIRRIHSR